LAIVLLGAAIAGLMTGCGGSSATATTTTDNSPAAQAYVKNMRALGAKLGRINRLFQARDVNVSNALVVHDLQEDAAQYGLALKQLEKMSPPAPVAEPHQQMIDAVKLYRTELLSAANKIQHGYRQPLTTLYTNSPGLNAMVLASLMIVNAGYNILSIDANAN
jgi:hypothetical protein